MALVVLLLAAAVTAGVYAYLQTKGNLAQNTIEPAPEPTIQIQESLREENDRVVKENVCVDVGNPGYAVYVRATIVATWQDQDGNIFYQMPTQGTAYTLQINTEDWFQAGEFYYFKKPVNSGKTDELIELCKWIGDPPVDGYDLHVEVIAQTIQAVGTTDEGNIPAVEDAWKDVKVDDDSNLIPKPKN